MVKNGWLFSESAEFDAQNWFCVLFEEGTLDKPAVESELSHHLKINPTKKDLSSKIKSPVLNHSLSIDRGDSS